MEFEEALKLLKNGKKIRRPNWGFDYVSWNGKDLVNNLNQKTELMIEDVLKDDWVEYREPIKLSNEEKELIRKLFEYIEEFPSVEYAYRVDKRADYLGQSEYLRVWYKIKGGDPDYYVCSPQFVKGEMFKCFDPLDYYKIEELGLYNETNN